MNTVVIKDVDLKQLSKDIDELANVTIFLHGLTPIQEIAYNNIMTMLKQWNTDYKGIHETR